MGFWLNLVVKENKKNKREHRGTSQRLFESYKKRKNSLSSSVFHLLLRERKKERKRHTHTLARATTTRVKYKRKREETERQNKKKERERERLHISRGAPLSWFRNRSTAWSVIVFFYPEREFLLRRALSFLPSFTCARVVNIYKIFSSSNPSSSSSSRHDLLLLVVVLFFYIKITLSIARVRFKVTRAFVCYLNVMFFSLRVSLFFFFFFQFFFFL